MGYFRPNYQQGFSLRVSVVRASNHNTCCATFEYATHNTAQIESQKYVNWFLHTYLPQALYWKWTTPRGSRGSKGIKNAWYIWICMIQIWSKLKNLQKNIHYFLQYIHNIHQAGINLAFMWLLVAKISKCFLGFS